MAIKVGDALLMVGADTKDLDQGMDRVNKNIKQGTDKWKGQLKAAGAAFTAVGVAGLALVASSKKMNASLGQTALTLGATTGELRDLALAVTNVTFPLESVTATFELLARAGIRDQQVLAASATAFDTLADATGSSAETVASQLIPAFKLFNLEIPQSAEELDKFTWLTKNTTVEIAEFGSVMSYVAQYGADLNLELDDMIAIMAVLESKGQSGATATKMFRTAVTQAASGASTLNEALGITQEEVDGFREQMDGAVGITQDYADVANTQYGLMDKLKQKWSEITLTMGSFLEPLEPILGAMAAIGPLMMVLSTSMGQAAIRTAAHAVALIAHAAASAASAVAMGIVTAATWLWNVALNANPIMLVVTVVGLLVGALIGLATKFQFVRDALVKVWDSIKIVFATSVRTILEKAVKPFLSALAKVIDVGSSVVGFFNKEWGESMKRAADSVRGAVDGAIEWTYRLEDNARAHRDQVGAIEEVTRVTQDEIIAANEYDAALYGLALTTESLTGETEDLGDALDDEAIAFDNLEGEADEATRALREFKAEQDTAATKVERLWSELVTEKSELAAVGVTLDEVTKFALAMGVAQEEVARQLIITGGSADQATAMLAALGLTLEDVAAAYGDVAGAQAAQAAAGEEAAGQSGQAVAGLTEAEQASQDAADTFQQQIAGQPDWFVHMAAFVANAQDTVASEITNNLGQWLKGVAESGGDISAAMETLYGQLGALQELTDYAYTVTGYQYAVAGEGWEAGLADIIAGLDSYQQGDIIPEPTLDSSQLQNIAEKEADAAQALEEALAKVVLTEEEALALWQDAEELERLALQEADLAKKEALTQEAALAKEEAQALFDIAKGLEELALQEAAQAKEEAQALFDIAEGLRWLALQQSIAPAFQHGGIVPGAVGQPVMALVHGGETITPPGQSGGITNTFNIAQLTVREEVDIRRIAEELYRLGQLRSVIHG